MEKPGLKPGALFFQVPKYQILVTEQYTNSSYHYFSPLQQKKICDPLPDTDSSTCAYTESVTFTWHARKAVANLKKHGVDFREAATVFHDPLSSTFPDAGHAEVEQRFLTIGRSVRGSVLIVAHTEEDDTIRIISARPATRRELRFYEEN